MRLNDLLADYALFLMELIDEWLLPRELPDKLRVHSEKLRELRGKFAMGERHIFVLIKLIDAATLYFEPFVDCGPHAREFFELLTDKEFEGDRKMWEPVIEANGWRTIEEIQAE
jgi:hypothetical protein